MATHSSIPVWKIPWTEEHGELEFTRLQRVGHDSAFTHACISKEQNREITSYVHWRKKMLKTQKKKFFFQPVTTCSPACWLFNIIETAWLSQLCLYTSIPS